MVPTSPFATFSILDGLFFYLFKFFVFDSGVINFNVVVGIPPSFFNILILKNENFYVRSSIGPQREISGPR